MPVNNKIANYITLYIGKLYCVRAFVITQNLLLLT
jgi:hypothetical protein